MANEPKRGTTLSARFDKALAFASELHRKQVRKGTTIPYVSHLLGVASLALEHGADEDQAIAALLHDAVEDQGGLPTLERIKAAFGERVARIVMGCTDSVDADKPEWRPRKERYLAHLATADKEVLLVSACDKLYNARAILGDYRGIGEKLWERFTGRREGTLWYYRALVGAYQKAKPGVPTPLLDEFDRTVKALEQLASAA